MRPVLPSLLISVAAAGGGTVQVELTSVTYGDALSRPAMSVPTARAAGPSAPAPSSVTLMTNCMSPRANLSDSSWVACADSDVGSWKPPADRLLATGMPKMPAATITNAATRSTRRGAAMARCAMRWSNARPSPEEYRR